MRLARVTIEVVASDREAVKNVQGKRPHNKKRGYFSIRVPEKITPKIT